MLSPGVPVCAPVSRCVSPGTEGSVGQFTACVLKSLPSRRQFCIWGLPGSEIPVPALSVCRGRPGLLGPFGTGALGVSTEPAPEPAQSGSSDRFMTNKRIKPSAPLLPPCFPHSHEGSGTMAVAAVQSRIPQLCSLGSRGGTPCPTSQNCGTGERFYFKFLFKVLPASLVA